MKEAFAAIFLSLSLTFAGNAADPEQDARVLGATTDQPADIMESYKILPEGYEITDPKCTTKELHPDETAELIRRTQTKDLNFVALAKAEAGLYNKSYVKPFRGIFQIHEGFHILEDYCDPVEQVQWLEWKLDQGAPVEKLFPNTYHHLYTPQDDTE